MVPGQSFNEKSAACRHGPADGTALTRKPGGATNDSRCDRTRSSTGSLHTRPAPAFVNQARRLTVNNWLTNYLLPSACLLCGNRCPRGRHIDLCPDCTGDLDVIDRACRRCGAPMSAGVANDGVCGRCQRHPPAFDRCFAPYAYDGNIGHLITRLKYGHKLACARLLGAMLADRIPTGNRDLPRILIPVPLHPARMRERGFNQAVEIARAVSRRTGIPLDADLVRRTRATPSQVELPRRERLKNVRGAFAVSRAAGWRHVAILDDVVTTGSTASEIARTLKASGVKQVSVWAVARTPE
jgi:ComF family protein